ncbi:unnamed protein product [Orchesella dallaii]|uniref:Uncharacterized protein n=1 Tax=Orchesella dallaii TaxID=48710 RepID=A0ABP1RYJ6_9HEXA
MYIRHNRRSLVSLFSTFDVLLFVCFGLMCLLWVFLVVSCSNSNFQLAIVAISINLKQNRKMERTEEGNAHNGEVEVEGQSSNSGSE